MFIVFRDKGLSARVTIYTIVRRWFEFAGPRDPMAIGAEVGIMIRKLPSDARSPNVTCALAVVALLRHVPASDRNRSHSITAAIADCFIRSAFH
jgi:hypothetical protein